jgi:hypothetical protein
MRSRAIAAAGRGREQHLGGHDHHPDADQADTVLEQIAPLIGDEATLIYQGVKSILNSLRSDGVVTTAQQDTDLDALDRRVDAAWDKIAPQFDPDAAPDATPT